MPTTTPGGWRLGRRVLLLALLGASTLTLAANLVQEPAAEDPGAAPGVTVFLVRHAEKGKDDPRDPTLTKAGEARARTLARLLGEAGVTHLFSTDYRRTRATLGPLVEAIGVELELYDPRRLELVGAQLAQLPAGSVAVVAGHSNTTPELFHLLTGREGRNLEESAHGRLIPEEQYDRLYCVTLVRGGEGVEGPARAVAGVELRYGD